LTAERLLVLRGSFVAPLSGFLKQEIVGNVVEDEKITINHYGLKVR